MTELIHFELILVLVILLATYGLFSYYKLWPSIASIRDLADLLNTKGGVILLLAAFSGIFFFAGMRWLYWTTMLIVHKEITPDNAMIGLGFSWISGAAFGASFGAMLNAMKGETAPPPSGGGTTSTKTETIATVSPVIPVADAGK